MLWEDMPKNATEKSISVFGKLFKEERERILHHVNVNYHLCSTTSSCPFNCNSCHPLLVLQCYTSNKLVIDETWENESERRKEKSAVEIVVD